MSVFSSTYQTLRSLTSRFSRLIVLGLSVLFLSLSTALHFARRGTLAEFLIAIITIVPISSAIRATTKEIVSKLQNNDYELLAGIFNGVFGYLFHMNIEEVANKT
jgi:hypothetical protein